MTTIPYNNMLYIIINPWKLSKPICCKIYDCDAVVSWVKLTVNVLAAILWAASIVIDAVTIASAGDAPYVQC